ncbi:MAG: hypothetical protein J6U82_01220 [Alistipes sp.]|nr:hypothetical protein [Alistipes sp.]
MTTNNQEIAVIAIAIVVGIILIRRIWNFFFCQENSSCAECSKECNRRKQTK